MSSQIYWVGGVAGLGSRWSARCFWTTWSRPACRPCSSSPTRAIPTPTRRTRMRSRGGSLFFPGGGLKTLNIFERRISRSFRSLASPVLASRLDPAAFGSHEEQVDRAVRSILSEDVINLEAGEDRLAPPDAAEATRRTR